ncbi:threonine synthase [Treponema brennaborense]|uniref:Threonine synthase n=1 Tax=Treponema brennaborense (strain DSM 12168 / CIP 105900 / DD5/3) TaxID=906968 RepID=F4LMM2_TREBD|nr:threonine synthase [Treponema brennaborense]AEE16769.1 threonine synthase [Treponema brennaborense DSM 12168]
MIYTDTRDSCVRSDFRTAVMNGMNAETGGLYIPVEFPKLDKSFLGKNPEPSFRDIAFESAKPFVGNEIPSDDLQAIIADAYPFSAQVVPVDPVSYVLELFHGPTCAFKDFGARFMARVMSYFNRSESDPLHILVATSGDTGSAVGSAFYNVPGLDVTILYPEGKISPLQEKQLSTFTGNVRSLRVAGTFDDCQKLVKTAFTDSQLRGRFRLSSANSINIARLLPQSFYYTYAALVVKHRSPRDNKIDDPAIIFTVPSGNFGNLTSGLIAREMGAPITGFVAATNANRTVPDWIASGEYRPRPSVATLSNAMDVGAPSNYERIKAIYPLEKVRELFASYWLDDEGTMDAIRSCYSRTGYIIDPHGAVAWHAWDDIRRGAMTRLMGGLAGSPNEPGLTPNVPAWAQRVAGKSAVGVILETAHPAKFGETVKEAIGREPSLPDRLEKVMSLPDMSIPMAADYEAFRAWLVANL